MPSLSEAYRAHPVHVQHKHPDLNSLQELPESYTWTHHSHDDHTPAASNESVPVIDLNDPNASKLIHHACITWGAYQVVNHAIPMSLLQDIQWVGETLFSLPCHQKQKAARSPDGADGYGLARISSFFPKLMWSEGFTIVGSPLEHFRQLWPQDYHKYWFVYKTNSLWHAFIYISSRTCSQCYYLVVATIPHHIDLSFSY